MPIRRQEFESGDPDPDIMVLEFLRSRPDYAYTLKELREFLATKEAGLAEKDLLEVPRSLQDREKVGAKTRRGMIYYIYRKPRLGFRA